MPGQTTKQSAEPSKADQTPIDQTPRERFVRLAQTRTGKAIVDLTRIQALANRNTYKYDQTDVDEIEEALLKKLHETITSLRAGKVSAAAFTLGTAA